MRTETNNPWSDPMIATVETLFDAEAFALWLTPAARHWRWTTRVRLNQLKINQTGHFTCGISHIAPAPTLTRTCFGPARRPAPTAVNITCESNLSNGNSRLPLLISNYMCVNDLPWFGLVARGGVTGFSFYSFKMQSYRFFCDTSAAHGRKQKLHKWKFTRIHFQLKPIPAMLLQKRGTYKCSQFDSLWIENAET